LAWGHVLLFREADPIDEAEPSTIVGEDFNTKLDEFLEREDCAQRAKQKHGFIFLVFFSFQLFKIFVFLVIFFSCLFFFLSVV